MSFHCEQCNDEITREDEISILLREHEESGEWHNFCSYTCLTAWLSERFAGQIDWTKVTVDDL